VPASYLHGLGAGLSHGKPYPGLVKAIKGTRMYDGTAFTFVNDSPDPTKQTWMQQIDNAPAFDFRLPSGPPAKTAAAGASTKPRSAAVAASSGSNLRLLASVARSGAPAGLLVALLAVAGWNFRRRKLMSSATPVAF
jgi:hypothetical protein